MGSLTQTGQRSGGITINFDQQRSGRAFASGLRKWWIPPAAKSAVRPDRAQYLTGGNPVWKGETAPPVASLGFVVVIP